LTSDGQRLATVFYRYFLQGLEILLNVEPLKTVAGFLQPAIQFLTEDQGQETAEDMTPDGLIPFVEYGTGVQKRLHVPEDMLDLPKLLILEGCLLRRQCCIRLEHPFPIIPRLLFDLGLVD